MVFKYPVFVMIMDMIGKLHECSGVPNKVNGVYI